MRGTACCSSSSLEKTCSHPAPPAATDCLGSHITFWGTPPSTVPQPLSLNPSLSPRCPLWETCCFLPRLYTKALLTAACTFYRNVIKMQEATSPFYFSSSRKPNQVCICISCRFSFPLLDFSLHFLACTATKY